MGEVIVGEVRELPDNYRPATSDDVPEGRACGNCIFFNEDRLDDEGRAWCERWEAFAEGGAYCNAWEPREETAAYKDEDEDEDEKREVDLRPPAYMRASARRGLEWHREGLSGDGVVDRTIREATAMSEGNVTADKWVRLRAWIARHLVDMDAPQNIPGNDGYPGAGAVAMALWGGGGSKRSAERALEYADGVVGRIEAENEGRVKGEALSKMETRVFEIDSLEVREEADGMHLEGYAALFNSRSENLGGFTETIAPGAFRASLKSRNDIKMLWNHDTGAVLGSTRAGTLTLTEDDRGLRVSAVLPNTSYGRDARELISRGDVTGFSFGFSMPARGGDEWNAEGTERVLKSVRLFEVSLTPFPAYAQTNGTATVRGLDKIAKRAEVDADLLADALLKIENGEDITTDDRQLLEKVLSELAPEPEAVEPEVDKGLEMLALKKKKLQLLMGY
jgi:HK97 family phage prohead protease